MSVGDREYAKPDGSSAKMPHTFSETSSTSPSVPREMTNLAISLALAYLLLGVAQVTEDLAARPLHKPFWALLKESDAPLAIAFREDGALVLKQMEMGEVNRARGRADPRFAGRLERDGRRAYDEDGRNSGRIKEPQIEISNSRQTEHQIRCFTAPAHPAGPG